MNKQNISACCLRMEALPEDHTGTVTFEPNVFNAADFSADVTVLVRKPGIDYAKSYQTTLSGSGALSLSLSEENFLSRFAGEYTLEVFRQDTGVRVPFRRNLTDETEYPGLCFCVYGCEIPVPTTLLVREFTEACPNACQPCPCP